MFEPIIIWTWNHDEASICHDLYGFGGYICWDNGDGSFLCCPPF